MDSSTINGAGIQVWKLDSNYNEVNQVSISSYSLDTLTRSIATLIPSSGLESNQNYRIKVFGGVKSAKGLTLAPPGSESQVMFVSEFSTGASQDTTSPQILGTNLEVFQNSQGNIVNVPVSGVVEVGFSEIINPTTFNINTVTLKTGTVEVSGSGSYDPIEGVGRLVPSSALSANTSYTLTFGSGIQDLAGNALATTTISFTTGGVDTTPPRVEFGNCDDYSCAITFSEPMNAAKPSDTIKGPSSVLNPKNYILWIDDFAPWETPGNVVKYYSCDNLAGVNCSQGSREQPLNGT
jgi:hypothetical protein